MLCVHGENRLDIRMPKKCNHARQDLWPKLVQTLVTLCDKLLIVGLARGQNLKLTW